MIQLGGSNLRQRVITGVVGALVLVLLIVFGDRPGTALIAAVLALGMIYEFAGITLSMPDKPEKRLVLVGTTWLIAFIAFWIPRIEFGLVLASFLGLFVYFLFSAGRHEEQGIEGLKHHFFELMFSVFGLLYCAFLPLFLPAIRGSLNGLHWTVILLLIVWAGDTGAYFAGKKYGKKKLYPLISPNKTQIGMWAGLGASLLSVLLYKLIFFRQMPWGAAILAPLIVGAVSQVGDLGESFLKRGFNVKDSGSILPGHGGFLDRFDGLVFALPIMYSLIKIYGS